MAVRVDIDENVDLAESSGVSHVDLTVQIFLSRCAVEYDLASQLVNCSAESHSGACRSRGYDVMSAGMSDLRQGVVFGGESDGDPGAAAVIGGSESPGDVAEILSHIEALLPEVGNEQCAGLFLFSSGLGEFVEIALDPHEGIKLVVYGVFNVFFECFAHKPLKFDGFGSCCEA